MLGHKLEAVVVDPASSWPLFAEKARELTTVQHVVAVFGCWTSVSRKSVAALVPTLAAVAADTRDAALDDIGGACFRSEIASMRYETHYTRLFRT